MPDQNLLWKMSVMMILMMLSFVDEVRSACCVSFDGEKCVACPTGMHVYEGNCIYDVVGCKEYEGGFVCRSCANGYTLNKQQNKCQPQETTANNMPNNNFLQVSPQNFTKQPINAIYNEFAILYKNNKQRSLEFVDIIRVYVRRYEPNLSGLPFSWESRYYRFIIATQEGLIQITCWYRPNVPDVPEVLTFFGHLFYQRTLDEEFVNFQFDFYRDQLEQQLVALYPDYSPTEIVDGFVSRSLLRPKNRAILTYRLFLSNPNSGLTLIPLTITLPQWKGLVIITQDKITVELSNIIKQIRRRTTELKDAKIIRITAYEGVYNLTYGHEENGKINRISYITFQVVNGVVIIGERYFSNAGRYYYGAADQKLYDQIRKIRYPQIQTQTLTSASSSISNSTRSTTAPEPTSLLQIKPPQRIRSYFRNGQITFKLLTSDLRFFKYLDRQKLVQSSIYDGFRNLTKLYYPSDFNEIFLNSQRAQGAIAQNGSVYVMEVTHKAENYRYFVFSIKKENDQMEYLRSFTVAADKYKITPINKDNRTKFIQEMTPDIKQLLDNFSKSDTFFVNESKLMLYRQIQFTSQQSLSSPIQKQFIMHQFKYYIPQKQNKSYEYIEYRFEIDKQTNSLRETRKTIYERQQFIRDVSELQENQVKKLVINRVYSGIDYQFQIQNIVGSASRLNIYRITYNFKDLYRITYEIDTFNQIPPFEVNSIRLPQNQTSPSPFPNRTRSSPPFNLTQFLKTFPTVDYLSSWKKQVRMNTTLDQLLSISEIKKIISDFFGIFSDNIFNSDIKIVEVLSLLQVIDAYVVQFREQLPVGSGSDLTFVKSQVRVFGFQTSRRRVQTNFNVTGPVVNITKRQAQQKSPALLQFIFGSKINIINQTSTLPNLQTQRLLQQIKSVGISPRFYSQRSPATFKKIRSLDPPNEIQQDYFNMLKKTPNILHINYVFTQNLPFLKNVSARQVSNDTNLVVLNFQHIYWRNFKVLLSKKDRASLELLFDNVGYVFATNSTTLINQIFIINQAYNFASQHLNPILKNSNYTQNNRSKLTQMSDVTHWRVKKLPNVYEFEFIFEFFDFAIAVGVIARIPENILQSNQFFLTYCYAYNTKVGEPPGDLSKKKKMEQIQATEEYKFVYQQLLDRGGPFFRSPFYELKNVSVIEQRNPETPQYSFFFQSLVAGSQVFFIFNRTSKRIETFSQRSIQKQNLKSGCVAADARGTKCLECNENFVFNRKQNKCYRRIQNCDVQSSQLCIRCNAAHVMSNNNTCL